MIGRWLGVVLVVLLVPGVAAADKYDDAVARTDKAFDAYKAVEAKYAALYAKWERYYKPIDVQYPIMVAARKKADDECAKNKRTKKCRDLTLAYAAEHKKYNALVMDKDRADPKQEFAPAALKPVEQELKDKKAAFETSKTATLDMFAKAYRDAKTKAERDQLDAKLAVREEKRNDKFAAGRSSAADSKAPRSNPSSSSSSGSSVPSGFDPNTIVTPTTKRW